MTRYFGQRTKKAGLAPGTPIYIGSGKVHIVKTTIFDYDEGHFQKKDVTNLAECFKFKKAQTVTWINMDGIHDIKKIEEVGKHFDLHPLLLEDVVNTSQRPKIEDYDDYLFIVLKMLYLEDEKNQINQEQVSLVLGPNFLLSFQETQGDVLDSVRLRIEKSKGRIRKTGSDYLAYSLIDAVVDSYFTILEKLGDEIEKIEEALTTNPSSKTMQTIHILKRETIFLRKAIWPLREIIGFMEKRESPLIKKSTEIYLRDVYDHTIQLIDTIETFRDILAGLLDVYLSTLSNRMNEVMKVLTIIATIFIPLTFVAGVYGMNFRFMPELNWPLGYPLILLVMFVAGFSMVLYFKRKKWF